MVGKTAAMDLAVSAIDFARALDPVGGRIPFESMLAWLEEKVDDAAAESRCLDAIALRVAVLYDAGEMSFEEADDLMNVVWAFSCRPSTPGVPDLAYEVFCAFDAGEYHHGDGADPERKYTRPEIRRIVAGRS